MSLNIFHRNSLVWPEIHESYILVSQFPSEHSVLRAYNQAVNIFAMVQDTSVGSRELMLAFRLPILFGFFVYKMKVAAKDFQFGHNTASDHDSNLAWHNVLEFLL